MKRYLRSLSGKLTVFTVTIIIPFIILIMSLLYFINDYSSTYNQIVKNVTALNVYNMNFKKSIDSTLYQMIARSIPLSLVEEQLEEDHPFDQIKEMEGVLLELVKTSTGEGNDRRISKIMKNLTNLEKRVEEINLLVVETGNYDESMFKLNTNIYILTDIIQEKIQEYIYYEVIQMEEVRLKLKRQQEIAIPLIFASVILVTGITSIVSVLITKSLTGPIRELCLGTELVAQGNFEIRTGDMKGNEIAVLGDSFNRMVAQIGELIIGIKEEQKQKRNMELKLLQSQINPHFLYNTLDNIMWLAEDGKTTEVVSMVTSLSDFFRTTLSEGRDRITLEEEVNHVRSYLEIQQFRYRDIMKFEIFIPEELKSIEIVKMTLQPLVENALYHGLKFKRNLGTIQIAVKMIEDKIVISITDDGIGMTEEKQREVRERLVNFQTKNESKSFGLGNVQERMVLNYGEDYGLKFESNYGIGTTFYVTIPTSVKQVLREE